MPQLLPWDIQAVMLWRFQVQRIKVPRVKKFRLPEIVEMKMDHECTQLFYLDFLTGRLLAMDRARHHQELALFYMSRAYTALRFR